VKQITRTALIAATIGPIQVVVGWSLAGALWPGYDPIKKTISDLAADDSPVKWLMSSFFVLGGTLAIMAAIGAKSFALPGRAAIFLSGLATYGFTIFATPSQIGYSWPHRWFAITSFVLMSAWPLLSMRFSRDAPLPLRPIGAILATLGFTILSVSFLATWTDPAATNVGAWERVIAVAQTWYLALVIWLCHFKTRTP
jgi:hypothetical membrane protein